MDNPTNPERTRWMIARAEYHERVAGQLRHLLLLLSEDGPSAPDAPLPTESRERQR